MSDPSDKSPRAGRAPLPRTNRPRPETSQRRRRDTPDGPIADASEPASAVAPAEAEPRGTSGIREPAAANVEPAPETVRAGANRAGTLPGVGGESLEGPEPPVVPEIRIEADAEANTEASLPPLPVEAQSAPSSVAG